MRWRTYLVGLSAGVLMAALAVALLVSTSTQTVDAADFTVDIRDFNFSPSTLTVQVGDVVRWTNGGTASHTTTSETGIWDSGNLVTGGVFAQQFTTAGTFPYFCRIHNGMRGTITVQAAATAVAPTAPAPTQPAATAPPLVTATATATVTATAVPLSPTPTTTPRPPELWILVLSPTPAWSLTDELLWIAAPGEWYRIYAQEAGWSLAVWEFDVPSNVVWIELDGRVTVEAF